MNKLLFKIIASNVQPDGGRKESISLMAIMRALQTYKATHAEAQWPDIKAIKTWLAENSLSGKTLEAAVLELTRLSASSVGESEIEARRAQRLREFAEERRVAKLLRQQHAKEAEEKFEERERFRAMESRSLLLAESTEEPMVDKTCLVRFFRTEFAGLDAARILSSVDFIGGIPVFASQRLELLKTPDLLNDILGRLSPFEALSFTSKLLIGSFRWRMPGQNDFIAELNRERLTEGKEKVSLDRLLDKFPPATINCWEMVLLAAYKANQIDLAYIDGLPSYQAYGELIRTQPERIWLDMGFYASRAVLHAEDSINRLREIALGQLLFYVPIEHGKECYPKDTAGMPILPFSSALRRPYPTHVVVALGEGKAVSLWDRPDHRICVQVVDVTAFNTGEEQFNIYACNPPWIR